jgi:hypothetical protein
MNERTIANTVVRVPRYPPSSLVIGPSSLSLTGGAETGRPITRVRFGSAYFEDFPIGAVLYAGKPDFTILDSWR